MSRMLSLEAFPEISSDRAHGSPSPGGSRQRKLRPAVARLGTGRAWLADRSDHAGAQRAAGGAFLIRVASAAIAFLSQPLLARWLGPHEFGIYAYVWTCLTLVGGVIDFGLATSAQRFIPEYAERKSLPLLRGFLSGSLLFAVAAATVVAALAAAAIALLHERIDRSVVLPLCLGCATLPVLALAIVQDGIARSFKWVWVALLPLYVVRPSRSWC